LKNIKPDIRFFEKDEVDKRFELILSEVKDGMSVEQVSSIIHKHLESGFIHILPLNSNSLKVFRVTIPYDGFNEKLISCYSYPRKKNLIKTQRANIANHPVFYCSLDPLTAILEMKENLSLNSQFYISEWELDLSFGIKAHSLLYSDVGINAESLTEISRSHEKMLQTFLLDDNPKVIEGFLHTVKKIADTFLDNSIKGYLIPSSYAHNILYSTFENTKGKIDIPILLYPSVQNEFGSINLALHPRIAKEPILKLIRTYDVEMGKNNDDSIRSININKRIVFNGKPDFQFYEKCAFQIIEFRIESSKVKFSDNSIFDTKSIQENRFIEKEISLLEYLENEVKTNIFNSLIQFEPKDQLENPLRYEGNTYRQIAIVKTNQSLSLIINKKKKVLADILIEIIWRNEWKKID
jgi:hypothetical protein